MEGIPSGSLPLERVLEEISLARKDVLEREALLEKIRLQAQNDEENFAIEIDALQGKVTETGLAPGRIRRTDTVNLSNVFE
ncbi:hypothetical protein DASB73_020670 [Starmerella bacillaris]|uniref:Uncharacterized protein n=1 Tax=Starmerella bacillaris TaxID=1247836 RepID=A0AAV5RKN7_STABA|nr:hypothetical protein DASB73_020670 [Starmerella bacillaris]